MVAALASIAATPLELFEIEVVAVGYGDAREIGSLPPSAIPGAAARAGARGCLLDTASKDGRTLFDHLGPAELAGFVAECRTRGLLCGLAGSHHCSNFR